MTNLNLASRQWATRPDDERFLTIEELLAAVKRHRERALTFSAPLKTLSQYLEISDDMSGEFLLNAPDNQVPFTHHAFGQLATRAGVPAGYLRKLPTLLAQQNLLWGMQYPPEGYDEDAKVLIETGDQGNVRAFTSTTYGRIWDEEVVEAVIRANADGRWQVPAASYASNDPLRATTLYASPQDVFIFLVDPDHAIEVPGEDSPLYRGFITYNSEVGDKTFGVITFLYRYVCDNRIIWGASDVSQLLIRHTSGGPQRFIDQAVPALRAYSEGSVKSLTEGIVKAKAAKIAEDEKGAQEFLVKAGFTQVQARLGLKSVELSGGDPTNLWAVVNGLTDYAHGITYTDERVALEKQAGKLLERVAA